MNFTKFTNLKRKKKRQKLVEAKVSISEKIQLKLFN